MSTSEDDLAAAWASEEAAGPSQSLPAFTTAVGPDGFVKERRTAARAMEAKARAVEDHRGRVRVAELRLETAQKTAAGAVRLADAEEAVSRARRALAGALDQLSDAEADLAEVDNAVMAALSAAMRPETPQLYYRSLPEFVTEFISEQYRRPVGGKSMGLRWKARWWESAEAITRLDALWRAFELLRLDGGTGMSTWLRDHLDYHMGVLMSDTGPFADSREPADGTAPLPVEPPPPGQFPTW